MIKTELEFLATYIVKLKKDFESTNGECTKVQVVEVTETTYKLKNVDNKHKVRLTKTYFHDSYDVLECVITAEYEKESRLRRMKLRQAENHSRLSQKLAPFPIISFYEDL